MTVQPVHVRNLLIVFALAALAIPAHGAMLTWTLQDVTFSDAAMASGYYNFDPDTTGFSGFSISVTAGPVMSAFLYSGANSTAYWTTNADVSFIVNDFSRFIRLQLSQSMTSAGGNIPILTGLPYSYDCMNCSPFRTVQGGSVSSVPEPATAALAATGGMALLLFRRKRNRG